MDDKKLAKRFYKSVHVQENAAGFEVLLDGRALKSPAKAALRVPNEALANAIRDEFDAQKEEIAPDTMPLFSLAATAIDRVMTQRDSLNQELVGYGQNDLICYRCAPDEDPLLAEREAEKWGAIQAWMAEKHNVLLRAFDGIMPQAQSDDVAPALQKAITAIDDWQFVSLYRATTLSGSVSLGLAFVAGHIDVPQLMQLAFLDDYYQEEKWGADEWAIERRDHIQAELQDAFTFLSLLSAGK